MEQKFDKKLLFFFHIIAIELGVANSRSLEHDICDWQSVC